MRSIPPTDAPGNAAASAELWAAFVGYLYSRREENGQVGSLARYLIRRWDVTRSDWRRDRSDFSARDLFDHVRRDWRGYGLGERAIKLAVDEFLAWLRAQQSGEHQS